jgi:hypothetical protein
VRDWECRKVRGYEFSGKEEDEVERIGGRGEGEGVKVRGGELGIVGGK